MRKILFDQGRQGIRKSASQVLARKSLRGLGPVLASAGATALISVNAHTLRAALTEKIYLMNLAGLQFHNLGRTGEEYSVWYYRKPPYLVGNKLVLPEPFQPKFLASCLGEPLGRTIRDSSAINSFRYAMKVLSYKTELNGAWRAFVEQKYDIPVVFAGGIEDAWRREEVAAASSSMNKIALLELNLVNAISNQGIYFSMAAMGCVFLHRMSQMPPVLQDAGMTGDDHAILTRFRSFLVNSLNFGVVRGYGEAELEAEEIEASVVLAFLSQNQDSRVDAPATSSNAAADIGRGGVTEVDACEGDDTVCQLRRVYEGCGQPGRGESASGCKKRYLSIVQPIGFSLPHVTGAVVSWDPTTDNGGTFRWVHINSGGKAISENDIFRRSIPDWEPVVGAKHAGFPSWEIQGETLEEKITKVANLMSTAKYKKEISDRRFADSRVTFVGGKEDEHVRIHAQTKSGNCGVFSMRKVMNVVIYLMYEEERDVGNAQAWAVVKLLNREVKSSALQFLEEQQVFRGGDEKALTGVLRSYSILERAPIGDQVKVMDRRLKLARLHHKSCTDDELVALQDSVFRLAEDTAASAKASSAEVFSGSVGLFGKLLEQFVSKLKVESSGEEQRTIRGVMTAQDRCRALRVVGGRSYTASGDKSKVMQEQVYAVWNFVRNSLSEEDYFFPMAKLTKEQVEAVITSFTDEFKTILFGRNRNQQERFQLDLNIQERSALYTYIQERVLVVLQGLHPQQIVSLASFKEPRHARDVITQLPIVKMSPLEIEAVVGCQHADLFAGRPQLSLATLAALGVACKNDVVPRDTISTALHYPDVVNRLSAAQIAALFSFKGEGGLAGMRFLLRLLDGEEIKVELGGNLIVYLGDQELQDLATAASNFGYSRPKCVAFFLEILAQSFFGQSRRVSTIREAGRYETAGKFFQEIKATLAPSWGSSGEDVFFQLLFGTIAKGSLVSYHLTSWFFAESHSDGQLRKMLSEAGKQLEQLKSMVSEAENGPRIGKQLIAEWDRLDDPWRLWANWDNVYREVRAVGNDGSKALEIIRELCSESYKNAVDKRIGKWRWEVSDMSQSVAALIKKMFSIMPEYVWVKI
jgi:hypothetical protein